MKRRNVIKSLTLIPIAGSVLPMESIWANPVKGTGSPLLSLPLAPEVEVTKESFMAETNIFRSIGVEPIINCRGTFTIISGSLERPEVRAAMEAAAHNFVQYDELADGIGQRLAELTGAEWGMVSAGDAAGLKHITAGIISGGDPEKLIRIPHLEGLERTEVIVPRSSRSVYDHAIRNTGVTMITIDTIEELESAINPKTVMIYMGTGDKSWTGAPLSLENISKIAKARNIPVLFDAANEDLTIPPIHFKRGATIVAYSGGKAICGPQCAGLMLGDKSILMSAWQASAPHHGPGRDNKVGREEMIGMLAAVEAWIKLDHEAIRKKWLSYLDLIINKISSIPSVQTRVHTPSTLTGLSNNSPELIITWDAKTLNFTGEEMAEELARNKPRIAVASGGGRGNDPKINGIAVTTTQMQPGEDKIVADRIYEVLTRKRSPKSTAMKAPLTNISGSWDVTVQFYHSKVQHKFFIEQDGNWIKGSHQGSFAVRDMVGTIEGDQIKLRSVVSGLIGDNISSIFYGTVSGDTMSGDIYMVEYRNAKFTATRDTKQAPRELIMVPGGGPMAT